MRGWEREGMKELEDRKDNMNFREKKIEEEDREDGM